MNRATVSATRTESNRVEVTFDFHFVVAWQDVSEMTDQMWVTARAQFERWSAAKLAQLEGPLDVAATVVHV